MPALAPRPVRGLAHWPHCRVAVEVVTTMTSADVMWQDGSVECNIRSNDLFPVHHLDNNEFCPGDFVVDKRGSAGSRRPFLLRAWETGKRAQVRRLPREWLLFGGLGEPSPASLDRAREHVGSGPCCA